MELTSTECKAMNADVSKELSYDPMEIDHSQYTDDVQPLEQSIEVVKIEAIDPKDG